MTDTETIPAPIYDADAEASLPELLSAEQLAEFSELYMAEYPNLLYRARRFSKTSDPEGLVQTAFEKALKSWDSYKENGKGRSGWLHTIMFNAGISEYRKAQCRPKAYASTGEYQYKDEFDPTTAGRYESVESDNPVAERIDSLLSIKGTPSHWKAILELRAQGYTHVEISEILNRPIGTIRSGLHRIIGRLAADSLLQAAYNDSADDFDLA